MKRSQHILLFGATVAGLCGCNVLVGLDRFNGATSAIDDEGGVVADSGASSALSTREADANDEAAEDSGSNETAVDETGTADGAGDAGDMSPPGDAAGDGDADQPPAADAPSDSPPPDAAPRDGGDSAAPDAGSDAAGSDATRTPDAMDAAMESGTASDASPDASDGGPALCYNFDTDVEGWAVRFADLGDAGVQDCSLVWSATEGSPNPGALEFRAPYSAGNQLVNIGIEFAYPFPNLAGRTLSFRVKLVSGLGTDSSHLGVVMPFLQDVNYNWVDNGGTPLSPSNGWVTVTVNMDHPRGSYTKSYSATQIRVIGIQFATWGGTGAPADILIDSVVVQ